jgi:hypothetical protein
MLRLLVRLSVVYLVVAVTFADDGVSVTFKNSTPSVAKQGKLSVNLTVILLP